jgi:hypothetical protein
MLMCNVCGQAAMQRSHRQSLAERLFYLATYKCRECGAKQGAMRPAFVLLSLRCRCPQCGDPDVSRLRQRDRIDRIYKNPISLAQALLGAPLYHCSHCRLQFYDYRPRVKKQPKEEGAA